ncbi:MAG: hypothetical protein HYZ79_02965 [Candidatus Melainabacteria bacterium]|nr:hypothetical protein [Candidatus Melainabacteria bacterium]
MKKTFILLAIFLTFLFSERTFAVTPELKNGHPGLIQKVQTGLADIGIEDDLPDCSIVDDLNATECCINIPDPKPSECCTYNQTWNCSTAGEANYIIIDRTAPELNVELKIDPVQ